MSGNAIDPARVAPECSCTPGLICLRRPCCYYGEAVPENVRSPLTPPEDLVNHPPHYTGHPSGVECITVTEHMGFCLGNAVKYIWRAGSKGDAITDLRKARWYLDREISRLERTQAPVGTQGGGIQSAASVPLDVSSQDCAGAVRAVPATFSGEGGL
ncbi:SaV-like [uncultured Caudovirales phage]|uniref:SaV-like n=1 Tax=uncultured Caudovirales phage TaxID=2100421 RepID=A0A6J5L105_9CAUD|nr:SaV-like [uncultured Caudovirales phage]